MRTLLVVFCVGAAAFFSGFLIRSLLSETPTTPSEVSTGLTMNLVPAGTLRKQCYSSDFCDKQACAAFVRGQIELWAYLESEGRFRTCLANKNEQQISDFASKLESWLTSEGSAPFGFQPSATVDIVQAIRSSNFCPVEKKP